MIGIAQLAAAVGTPDILSATVHNIAADPYVGEGNAETGGAGTIIAPAPAPAPVIAPKATIQTAPAPAPAAVVPSSVTQAIDPTQAPTTNPIIANATPTPTTTPNWDAIAAGQIVNGGTVLDATTFKSSLLPLLQSGGEQAYGIQGPSGAQLFSSSGGFDNAAIAKALGKDLGPDAHISVAGFTPIDTSYVTGDAQDGLTRQGGEGDFAANQAAFAKAIANPNAIFVVDSENPGGSSLNRNNTAYVMRGDRLIPVASNDYKETSGLQDFKSGITFLAASTLGAVLGPSLAAFLGGGITGAAGAGAITGAVNSGLNGGNILKGAAIGGIVGGAGQAASTGAQSLGASQQVGNIVKGITTGALKTELTGGSDVGINALLGGLGGANLGNGNNFLNSLINTGASTVLKKP